MLFNSFDFIFLFLPTVYFVFRISNAYRPQLNGTVLLAASIGFYAYSSINYLPLLLISIAANYIISLKVQVRPVFYIGIALNLAILFWYKYALFVLGIFTDEAFALESVGDFVIPLGISFYTFQQISYLTDIRSRAAKKTGPLNYAAYIALFPQLIAGPIVRYKSIDRQLSRLSRGISDKTLFALLSSGIFLFALGLFKKVVIADSLGHWADPVYDLSLTGDVTQKDAWIATFAYTFQLYFDFSAYSDMALGLGRIFGIMLPANFWSPYKSRSIIAFWQRWHMSLSFFVRDYLYIPLGGNRLGFTRQIVNLTLVFIVMGIWHGAGYTFIVWGALHAGMTVIAHIWSRLMGVRLPSILGVLITFFSVHLAWVVFKAETLDSAKRIYIALFNETEAKSVFILHGEVTLGIVVIAVSAVIAFFTPNTLQWLRSRRHAMMFDLQWPQKRLVFQSKIRLYALPILAGVALFLAISSIGLTSSTFLYFNF